MRLGHGQTRAVLILWAWTALLSGLVLYPSLANRALSLVPVGFAALVVALYTLFGVRGRADAAQDPSHRVTVGGRRQRAAPEP